MAITQSAIQLALNYVTLTDPVKRIMNTLPRVLPSQLYTQTNPIRGNKYRRVVFRPNRQVARLSPYGAPPRTTKQTGAGVEDVVMIHSSEQIDAGTEVLEMFMEYADYKPQEMANQELDRRSQDFAIRQENLRTTSVGMLVAQGKIFFDAEGDLDTTDQSGNGGITVDIKVPSGNSQAAGVNFNDPAAEIVNWIEGFKVTYMRATGRRIKYAICGRNISGYLAKNTSFREWARYNRALGDNYVSTGLIPGNATLFDIDWIFGHMQHFEKANGTIVGVHPDDQITFLPELTPDVYQLQEGSVPVPKQFYSLNQNGDFTGLLREMMNNQVYGIARYAYGIAIPFPQITIVQQDTFFPDFKLPNAIYFIDTTP